MAITISNLGEGRYFMLLELYDYPKGGLYDEISLIHIATVDGRPSTATSIDLLAIYTVMARKRINILYIYKSTATFMRRLRE